MLGDFYYYAVRLPVGVISARRDDLLGHFQYEQDVVEEERALELIDLRPQGGYSDACQSALISRFVSRRLGQSRCPRFSQNLRHQPGIANPLGMYEAVDLLVTHALVRKLLDALG